MYFVAHIYMLDCCNGASTSNNRKETFYSVLEKKKIEIDRENGLSLGLKSRYQMKFDLLCAIGSLFKSRCAV